MRYNRIGRSELLVSEVGLGCMSLSEPQGADIIREAIDFGINYFDTADLYDRGANETLLGKATAGIRHDIVLATKAGNQWEDGKDGWVWNPTKVHLLRSVDHSLKRLQTDYIDLYQLHGGTIEDNFEEIIETFEYLVQQGKIRYYGLSSIRPNVFQRYLRQSRIVSNMMQYSLLDTRPEEFFDSFVRSDVGVIARGSMAQGLLLDKAVTKPYLDHTVESVHSVRSLVARVRADLHVSEQAIALKYCLDKPAVSSAVVGVRTRQQLVDLKKGYEEQLQIADKNLDGYFLSLPRLHYRDHRE